MAADGPGLAFIVYPTALAMTPAPRFLNIVFFVTIFFVGLDSQFINIEGFVTSVQDRWPEKFPDRRSKVKLLAVKCGVSFLLGIFMTLGNGIYLFDLLDQCAVSGLCLIFLAICQCLAVKSYGPEKFYREIFTMASRSQLSKISSLFFVLCWKYGWSFY